MVALKAGLVPFAAAVWSYVGSRASDGSWVRYLYWGYSQQWSGLGVGWLGGAAVGPGLDLGVSCVLVWAPVVYGGAASASVAESTGVSIVASIIGYSGWLGAQVGAAGGCAAGAGSAVSTVYLLSGAWGVAAVTLYVCRGSGGRAPSGGSSRLRPRYLLCDGGWIAAVGVLIATIFGLALTWYGVAKCLLVVGGVAGALWAGALVLQAWT